MSNETAVESQEKCFKTIASLAPPLFQNGKVVLQTYHIGWIISGFFTLVAVAVSFWLIRMHLKWYTNKREQRYIVRILFMVPLYAIISFAAFLFWNHATPLILIRDAYEAIVLTAFFYLLLMYLSHDPEEQKRVFMRAGLSVEADNISARKGQEPAKWVFPLGSIKWKPRDGLYFLQIMKWGVLQYCVVRPASTLAAVILNYLGLYCEDSWGVQWGHVYITIVMSISVTIAMYCLLQMYFPVAKDLSPHQPLLKLFSVKAVVFLTFWQATFLSLLGVFGIIKDTKYMTADDVNNAIGAILETFEMMLFAFLHIKAFTYRPYSQASKGGLPPSQTPQWRSLGHAMDFRETFRELWTGCIYMLDNMRGREPTPDFGVIRESHYEGAFGRQRQSRGRRNKSPVRDTRVKTADLTFPAVEIEVDREVEVIINGRREWLLPEIYDQRRGHPRREKSEGLQEQIDRELALRGYTNHAGELEFINERENTTHGTHVAGQSWWRSLYNRISHTGHEPEVQPARRGTLSRLRSHRHSRNSNAQHYPPEIIEQSLRGVFYPPNPRPFETMVAEEYNPILPHGDARECHDDLRPANQSWHDDRDTVGHPLTPPGDRLSLRPSRIGAGTPPPQQAPRSLSSIGNTNIPHGPSPLNYETHAAMAPLGPISPHAQTLVPPPQRSNKPKSHLNPGKYPAFEWGPPPQEGGDTLGSELSAPVDTSRNSVYLHEGAAMHEGRVSAWLRSQYSNRIYTDASGSPENQTNHPHRHP